MKITRISLIISVVFASVFLSGCVHLYEHSVRGEVTPASVTEDSKETTRVVIYWYSEKGRVWYGGKEQGVENSAGLRICEDIPKEITGQKGRLVILASDKGDDLQVATSDESGSLTVLETPERQEGGAPNCGGLFIKSDNGSFIPLSSLTRVKENDVLAVQFLCQNIKGTRYPKAGFYELGKVVVQEVENTKNAPKPCEEN